ncbi:hypothetical protein REPUB_Repub02eG0167800 [Reevesia pubescens]
MDASLLLKESMDEYLESATWSLVASHLSQSQKRPSETGSEDDEDGWRSSSQFPQVWDPGLQYPGWNQSNNQAGISCGVFQNQISNVSTVLASQSPTISNASLLKRTLSSLSGSEGAQRKRKIDQAYRERCRNLKAEMQMNLENLTGENESLMNENKSLKKDDALMNQTLRDQAKEIDRLRSDLSWLKREYEKQNVLA